MSDQDRPPRTPHRNPFPGPQPYRAGDRGRFFGREALTRKMVHQILAHPATTLFGPSGAGKSSLMQAGVIPSLEEEHDFRLVRVDGWPPGEAPLEWLLRAIFSDLELGAPGEAASPLDVLDEAMAMAARRSDRPVLIYLDQIEQLLFPGRAGAEIAALIQGVDRLSRSRRQGLHLVLSLREDYLGRFRDRARGRRELLAHGFRLSPLTVEEMVKAVCRAAGEGEPAQAWDEAQTRALMLEVRAPGQSASDEAEVQAAFGQIVCRALWEERSESGGRVAGAVEAEAILQRYLEATVGGLGDLEEAARVLLQEHLIDAEGNRTLLTEKQARLALPGKVAEEVLLRLERAAILHAEEHQGSRYFELGHDWLARRVLEQRNARQAEEAKARRRARKARRREQERALRQKMASRHAEAARRIWESSLETRASRRDALQEVGRALALEPTNADAMRILAAVLTTLPAQAPEEVKAEVISLAEARNRRFLYVWSASEVVGLSLTVMMTLWMGVRDIAAWVAMVGLTLLSMVVKVAAANAPSARLHLVTYAAYLLNVLAFMAFSRAGGPFVIVPTVLAIWAMSFCSMSTFGLRRIATATSCLAPCAVVGLELIGVLPPSYVFRDGTMTIVPNMVSLPEAPTLSALLICTVTQIVTPAYAMIKFQDSLREAQERAALHAWHLRQLLPDEAPSPETRAADA